MANIVRRPVGPNDAGIPEDEVRDVIIPMVLPPGTVLIDPRTGDTFDNEGRKLPKTEVKQRGQAMVDESCRRCHFWRVLSEQFLTQDEQHLAGVWGHCYRYAPRPMLDAPMLFAAFGHEVNAAGDKILPVGIDAPTGHFIAHRPVTADGDWCGDFRQNAA